MKARMHARARQCYLRRPGEHSDNEGAFFNEGYGQTVVRGLTEWHANEKLS